MGELYCISGLGADERIFSRLKIPGVHSRYLQWVAPLPNESMEHYAGRMLKQVQDPAGGEGLPTNPIFLGVSFGGMMAIEMARHLPAATVILVSSVGQYRELPRWMRICGLLRLNRLIPPRPSKWMFPIENYFLGAETREEIQLCNEFRSSVDPGYLHWAIGHVLNWRNEWSPSVLYHLHGTKDRIFPWKRVRATHTIQGGGHFMISNRAEEIGKILSGIYGGIGGCEPHLL
jgi:pimeloyl-ACP methyl ester carboxylesterase